MQESLEPLTATPVDCGEGTSPHSSQVTELRYSQGVFVPCFFTAATKQRQTRLEPVE